MSEHCRTDPADGDAPVRFLRPLPGPTPLTVATLTNVSDELDTLRGVGGANVRLLITRAHPPCQNAARGDEVPGGDGIAGPLGRVVTAPGSDRWERHTMRALSDVLWRERDLLGLLLHRLEVEDVLRAAGRTARLPLAAREVDDALAETRSAELGRAVEAESSAEKVGLPPDASLRELAGAARPPWDELLLEHRAALRELVDQIDALRPGATADPGADGVAGPVQDPLPDPVPTWDERADGLAGEDDALAAVDRAEAIVELQMQELLRTAAVEAHGVVRPGLLHFLR